VRAFACAVCSSLLGFENSVCVTCGTDQGFSMSRMSLVPVPTDGSAVACANLGAVGCQWLVDRPGQLCLSCRLTRKRPNDADAEGLAAWAKTESAKRRLVYQLLDLVLPVVSLHDDPAGVAFELLSSRDESVITGHADGVVTIDLAEGNDAKLEAMRLQMGEAYRTMLGHLRHETGHYYWQVLVQAAVPEAGWLRAPGSRRPWERGEDSLATFRELFGDERADYSEALEKHYDDGPPVDWRSAHVSEYATAHPWEDWAETFAHYLHITDSIQTAAAYGIVIEGADVVDARAQHLRTRPVDAPSELPSVQALIAHWLPLSYALNASSRSMGHDDLYPFVLSETVIAKLGFVHDLIRRAP
jgi:hypothetical protein